MKKEKVVLVGLTILAMFLFLTQPAGAAAIWLDCEIEAIETDDSGTVTLTLYRASKDRSKQFTVPIGEENRMLAVALTAMTNGMGVRALFDWQNEGSDIECMILYAP